MNFAVVIEFNDPVEWIKFNAHEVDIIVLTMKKRSGIPFTIFFDANMR